MGAAGHETVAGNRLVRVSLRTGQAEKVIDLPGGFSTSMAGSPSGSFLIVSVAGICGQQVYFAATTGQGVNTHLKRVAVPAACQVG